jgi:transposase-like protein
VDMEKQKNAGSNPARDKSEWKLWQKHKQFGNRQNIKSICPHCSATNLSKIPVTHYVCTDCNKEYMATVGPHRRRLIYAISQSPSQF